MDAPIVSLRSLGKSYGNVRALDGLTFELQPGPIGLLGPNGAGKTTLLKLLLGLIEPDSGTATIAGEDPSTRAGRLAVRRSVGYMPESDCLIPGTSAVELVSMLARLSGLPRDDAMQRTHEVLDYVGLDEARYRDCDGYSTGMKQRLKLAQALAHDPPILLLDEPTNGLDPKGRRHMLDLVFDLGHAQKKSLLLCSHLLPDVERCCNDVIVLEKGRVVRQGSIAGLTHGDGLRVEVRVDPIERFRAMPTRGWREIERSASQPAHGARPAAIESVSSAPDATGSAPHSLGISVPGGPSSAELASDATFSGSDSSATAASRMPGTAAGSAGSMVLQLESDDCDPLFAAAAECGARVLSIEPVRATLEDVFLSALDKSDGARA